VIEGHRVILRETDQSHSSKGINAMTAAHNIDLPAVLAERLTTAHPDVLRELLATFIHTLMGAEADALCGAGYGERSAERTNSRNGYRHRQFDTRAGSLGLAIPKLRQGSYFPDWLMERRKRAERALTTVVATCYLLGVSTRRMDRLVETLGITSLSKSQVSVMAKELDTAVEAFRTRPLDAGPYTFVAADALVLKGSRGRAGGQRARPNRRRGQRRGLPRDPGHRRVHRRGRRRLVDVLAVVDRPRPVRGQTGDLRRPCRVGGRDRGHSARGGLAAVQNALHDQSDGGDPEVILAVGTHPAALGVRPT
jgi:putative transposase